MLRPRYRVCILAAVLLGLALATEGIGLNGALLAIACAAAVALSAIDIGWALRRPPQVLERELPGRLAVGEEQLIWVTLQNPHARPLRVRYSEPLETERSARLSGLPRLLTIPARHRARFAYGLRPISRGAFGVDACELHVSGPFGLWEARHLHSLPQRSRVGPALCALESLRLFYSAAGPAFSADLVLWIDTGPLMASTRNGERLLDHAIDAALALACQAMAQGQRVALHLAGGQGREYLSPGVGDGQLQALYQILEDPPLSIQPTDWAASATSVLEHTSRPAVVVLLTRLPHEPGQVITSLAAVAAAHRLIVVDSVEHSMHQQARSAVHDNASAHAYCMAMQVLAGRERVCLALEAIGAQTLVAPGTQLPEALLACYARLSETERLRPRRSGGEN